MPRTMRARVIGSCRRICTCYLRLIRSVLICMSFAAIDWSQVAGFEPAISCARGTRSSPELSHTPKLVRTAGLAPAASEFQARPSAADLRPENGHADRSCTCVKSLCRRPPIAAQPRRDIGVTGWTCTSYGGVTARGLSASPSATNWYPRQDLHPHDSRHYVLSVACLLIPPRGH
jgi:hypothetical protein